jgi:transposase-like protein
MLAGEAVKDLAAELGIGFETLYRWRRRALIDAGRRPEAKSYEADPLQQARRRIKQLEAELKWSRTRARCSRTAPLTQKEVPGCPRAEQPARTGHCR